MQIRFANYFDLMFAFCARLLSAKHVSPFTRHYLLCAALALSSCGQINLGPSKKEAEAAVRGLIGQATGIQLPPGCQLANVTIKACVWQESPEGHVCDVTLVSQEMPVIGAISMPMRLRFAKREGRWKAFLF